MSDEESQPDDRLDGPDDHAKGSPDDDAPTESPESAATRSLIASDEPVPVERPSAPAEELRAGQQLGPFRIEEKLGAGGMGEVWAAHDEEADRRVALKRLRGSLASDAARERFLREGRLAATVSHPNCVYVYGTREIDDNPVISMELVDGGTLADRVRAEGPLPCKEAVDAILQLIDGLEAAGDAGILHRDIKPANCFEGSGGNVKVGDFGLSISFEGYEATRLTQTGTLAATPSYASPEQLQGERLDERSDIYSLGATFFYLLTGRPPFQEDNLAVLISRILEADPPSPEELRGDVPKGLAEIVLECLRRDPDRRPQDYDTLRQALLPFSSRARVAASPWSRIGAYVLDFMLIQALALGITFGVARGWLGMPVAALPATARAALNAGGLLLWVAYLGVSEGIWGRSIGKAAVGIEVIRTGSGPPGLAPAAARAAVFHADALVTISVSFLLAGAARQGIVELAVGAAWTLALFATARSRNGWRGLHGRVTNTRVLHVERRRRDTGEATTSADFQRPTSGELGPYELVGLVHETDGETLYRARDPELDRDLWILAHESSTQALSERRKELARLGRLRWIDSGTSEAGPWNAFEFVPGVPLTELPREARRWTEAGKWLLQLAAEARASTRDDLPLCLDERHVWITEDGRALWLDVGLARPPARDEGEGTDDGIPGATHGAEIQRFLARVATRALDPEAPDPGEPTHLPRRPLPLRARRLLRRLTAAEFEDLEDVVAALDASLSAPDRVSRWRRLALPAACLFLLSPLLAGLGTGLWTSAADDMRLEREYPGADDLMRSLTWLPSPGTDEDPAPAAGDREQRPSTPSARVGSRIGEFISEIFSGPDGQVDDLGLPPEALETVIVGRYRDLVLDRSFWEALEEDDGDPYPDRRKRLEDLVARLGRPSEQEIRRAERRLGAFVRILDRPRWPDRLIPALVLAALLLSFVAILGTLDKLALRQGLGFRLTGIALVTERGPPASRARAAARSLLTWSPALLFVAAYLLGNLLAPPSVYHTYAYQTTMALLGLVCLAVLIASAVASARNPARGWNDRLAGTAVVPR